MGLGLVATGLVGVFLLSVQGGILGWTNRLTQYFGSAYLLIAAVASVRESGAWGISWEEALQASEDRFRAAFEGSAVAMSLTTPEGRLLRVDAAFCRMMGYSEGELTERDFYQITHPDDLPVNRAGVERMVRGETDSSRMEKR